MTSVPDEIVVVPHTHWDREWYEPHDVFRLRLVHMIDGLLDLLEREPSYRFTLDGQAAAINDYLEMRPENTARVRRLVTDGQLAIGPFLILLDEFCCDGETIIRNLELGLSSSRKLGPEMRLGYLPDMFGHAAQTPQILAGFGLEDTALWRGAPDAVRFHAFTWKALNGQGVRCEYLYDGYGNGLDLFALPGQLPELASEYARRNASWYDGDPVLAMLGSDHTAPLADLVERIEAAAKDPRAPRFKIATVAEYVEGVSARNLPEVTGELRSHARGNLLPGVFSIRTNLKQSMADAERAVNVAERLDALFPGADHQRFFETAWYRIVESTAHDSVTGCGVDSTAEQVETRLHTASHLARGVTEAVLKRAASGVSADDYLVVNPSSFARMSQVELVVGREIPPGAQQLAELPTVLGDEVMARADLVKLLRRIHGRELFGQQINGYTWGEHELRFDVGEVAVGPFDLAQFTRELESAPEGDWHVLTVAEPRHRILVQVPTGGLGVNLASAAAGGGSVRASATGLSNAQVQVTINEDGTVDVRSEGYLVERALRLTDEGDRGDSYNFGPLAGDHPVDRPTSVNVSVLEAGPLRGRVRIDRTYQIPVGVDSADRDRRLPELVEQLVSTVVELRDTEDFVRVEISLTNRARDHRLRVLVPTGVSALTSSASAGQYGVTTRGRTGEGGWGEFPLPTFPATVFAHAGQTTVLLDKLTEYEVTDPGDDLALTLVRSVGMMSVNVHPLRDEPAGSEIPVPGAQYLDTTVVTRFAILPSPHGWEEAEAARHADLFRLHPLAIRGQAPVGTSSELPAPAVTVATSGRVPLTSLRRVDAGWEARFVNYDYQDQELRLDTDREWEPVSLAGERLPGAVAQPIPASTIATFRTGR